MRLLSLLTVFVLLSLPVMAEETALPLKRRSHHLFHQKAGGQSR
jgi:hypothetical protein